MNTITLKICDNDQTIWVTADDDPVGVEYEVNRANDLKNELMEALAKMLGIKRNSTYKLREFLREESKFRLENIFHVDDIEDWLVEDVSECLLDNSEEIFNVDYIDSMIQELLDEEEVEYNYEI